METPHLQQQGRLRIEEVQFLVASWGSWTWKEDNLCEKRLLQAQQGGEHCSPCHYLPYSVDPSQMVHLSLH